MVRYDPEIADAAKKLHPYGDHWVEKFGRDFFALQEDRAYIAGIVKKLLEEAEGEAKTKDDEAKRKNSRDWAKAFSHTYSGEPCD